MSVINIKTSNRMGKSFQFLLPSEELLSRTTAHLALISECTFVDVYITTFWSAGHKEYSDYSLSSGLAGSPEFFYSIPFISIFIRSILQVKSNKWRSKNSWVKKESMQDKQYSKSSKAKG